MILPPKWSINMGPGVDMRGLGDGQPPRRLRPRVLYANEAAAAKVKWEGGSSPTLFLRVRGYASSLSVKIAAGWFRSPTSRAPYNLSCGPLRFPSAVSSHSAHPSSVVL